jgi:hypothetical protein
MRRLHFAPFLNKKVPKALHLRDVTVFASLTFSYPDFTVGTGISPVPAHIALAGCHRRSGLSPSPEGKYL